jgi:hypothetical protein
MRALPLILLLACNSDGTDTDTDAPIALEGSTYEVVLSSVAITGASGAAAELIRSAAPSSILMHADSADDTTVTWRLAFGTDEDPVTQDACARTTDLPEGTVEGDEFQVGPEDLDLPGEVPWTFGELTLEGTLPGEVPWTFGELTLEGTLSADRSEITDLTMSGVVDAREIFELLPIPSSAEALCGTFDGFGISCEACADSEIACASLEITGLSASRVDVDVTAVTSVGADCN